MWQRRHRQETEGQHPPQHGGSPAHSPLPGSFQGHAPALLRAPRAVTQRSWDPWSYGHSLSMEDFGQSSMRAPTKPEATSATSALPRLPADTPGARSQQPSATADGGDRVTPALTAKSRPSPQLHCVYVPPGNLLASGKVCHHGRTPPAAPHPPACDRSQEGPVPSPGLAEPLRGHRELRAPRPEPPPPPGWREGMRCPRTLLLRQHSPQHPPDRENGSTAQIIHLAPPGEPAARPAKGAPTALSGRSPVLERERKQQILLVPVAYHDALREKKKNQTTNKPGTPSIIQAWNCPSARSALRLLALHRSTAPLIHRSLLVSLN